MNRITATFQRLKKEGRKGLVGYLTAGDPDVEQSEQRVREAIEGGLDVLELGVPFSDATADGPTIQAASRRALKGGMNVRGALEIVERLRADYDIPIVLFGYANPLFRYGYESVCKDAAAAGVDGMLVVDLPFEHSDELRSYLRPQGMHFITLIAPTTPPLRAEQILKDAEGFVYYILVRGVTGARSRFAEDVAPHVEMLRKCTELPIAAGFGISNGEQAARAARLADAVVVGSALIQAAGEGRLPSLVGELREALDSL